MIDMLKISTGQLQLCCDMNTSMIDMLKISTGQLQSEIDIIIRSEIDGLSCCVSPTCMICVEGELVFDASMLPMENETVIFRFCPCHPKSAKPRLIFNGGVVPIPPDLVWL